MHCFLKNITDVCSLTKTVTLLLTDLVFFKSRNENVILDLKVTPVTTDESFLSNQFNGYYTPYWVDKKDKKGGMMVFVKPYMLSTGLANSRILSNTQIKTFKRILQKCNWLIGSISKAPSQHEKIFRFTFHKSVRILLSFLRKSHNS